MITEFAITVVGYGAWFWYAAISVYMSDQAFLDPSVAWLSLIEFCILVSYTFTYGTTLAMGVICSPILVVRGKQLVRFFGGSLSQNDI